MEAPLAESDIIPLIGELSLSLQSNPRAPYVVSRTHTESHCAQKCCITPGSQYYVIHIGIEWPVARPEIDVHSVHNTQNFGCRA